MAPRRPVRPQTQDPIAGALSAWRFWLLGALGGALLALALYYVAPPPFRARATVVVDANLEEAWVFFPDRQLFQFLARETERLEELAWSDAVMETVFAQSGIPMIELREGVLTLSHPSDGGWHLYATHPERVTAQTAAGAWANAFVAAAQAAVSASPELQAARQELEAAVAADADEAQLNELMEDISVIYEHTQGVSPYTEMHVSQSENLPAQRAVSQASYLFAGSLAGALAAALWVLVRPAVPQRANPRR